jgi:guanylate kinase
MSQSLSVTGTLFIVSAPSGAGKTTLVKALVDSDPQIEVSVSHTTRAPREGERDGVAYHFVDEATFNQLVEQNAFFEHAAVFDHHYGTSVAAIEALLEKGVDVLLEIDWQGAAQVHARRPDSVLIFVLPPSAEALEARLRGRGKDNDAVIQRRMCEAVSQMSHYSKFDYVIVNDEFDRALEELRAIVLSQRCRRDRQQIKLSALLEELLKFER